MIQLQENIWANPAGTGMPSVSPKALLKGLTKLIVALLVGTRRLFARIARAICADLDRMSKAQDERIRSLGYEPRGRCYFR